MNANTMIEYKRNLDWSDDLFFNHIHVDNYKEISFVLKLVFALSVVTL